MKQNRSLYRTSFNLGSQNALTFTEYNNKKAKINECAIVLKHIAKKINEPHTIQLPFCWKIKLSQN